MVRAASRGDVDVRLFSLFLGVGLLAAPSAFAQTEPASD